MLKTFQRIRNCLHYTQALQRKNDLIAFTNGLSHMLKTMIKPRFNVAEVKKTTSEGVALIILHCQTEIRLAGDKLRSEIQY